MIAKSKYVAKTMVVITQINALELAIVVEIIMALVPIVVVELILIGFRI